ncbi:MAG: glycosyl hydrolase [Candidatus Omnitrophica bacterium]|nr:glycosyl hydrolase [Candidatus Omnitrophota bacterium]
MIVLARDSKFVPSDGKIIFIIGQNQESINNYVRLSGQAPAGVMVYTSLQRVEGLDTAADYGSGVQHADYLLKKYPRSVIQIGLYMKGAALFVPKGTYDENLKILANWCKRLKRPIFLRIGYEFDFANNRYGPREYIQAFRYIVDFFNKEGVDNAAYVWHSAGTSQTPMQWYPGDEYVDWFGISFFHTSNLNNMINFARYAREHHKPLMIAEAAPYAVGAKNGERSWQEWFVPFFDFIEQENVKAVCYINCDWDKLEMFKGQGWGDSRIQDNGYIKDNWFKKISEINCLMESDDLFDLLK